MERRERSSVEESDVSECRRFSLRCPASGRAGTDSDSPYIVLTWALASGHTPAWSAAPPLCSAHRTHSGPPL